MNLLSSEVKILDLTTTQRNGDIITAVSLPDTNPNIPVLVLRKCNVRSIFRQCKSMIGPVIARDGPPDPTTLFDKVEFCYPMGVSEEVVGQRDHNYFRSIFGECG